MVRPGMSGGGFHGGRGLGGLGTESEPGIEELVRTSSLNFLPNVHLVDRHPYLMGVGEQKASEKKKTFSIAFLYSEDSFGLPFQWKGHLRKLVPFVK